MSGKRNHEWAQATAWDGYFTQDKVGGVTERVDPGTVMARLTAEGFLQQGLDSLLFDTTPESVPVGVGVVSWDADSRTLSIQQPGGVILQVGQETQILVVNKTGATIPNGAVVYLTGAQGNRPTVALAEADVLDHSHAIAVATQSLANNAEGFVTLLGLVRELDTSAWTEGAALYLSDAPGGLTDTAPTSRVVRVGFVVRSHATAGSILVTIERFSAEGGGSAPLSVVNVASSAFVLLPAHLEAWVRVTSGTKSTVTLPVDADLGSPATGAQIHLRQVGAGQVEISPASGVTVNTPETLRTRWAGSSIALVKVGVNTWDCTGDLEAL